MKQFMKYLTIIVLIVLGTSAGLIAFDQFCGYTSSKEKISSKASKKKSSKTKEDEEDEGVKFIKDSSGAMEDQTIYLDGLPPIYIQGNGTISRLSYNILIEALQDLPDWYKENCQAVYLESDNIFSEVSYTFSSGFSINNMDGYSNSKTMAVHIRAHYEFDAETNHFMVGGTKKVDLNEFDNSIKYSSELYNSEKASTRKTVFHEFGHIYDYSQNIVNTYDSSILKNYTNDVCTTNKELDSYCSSDIKETFAYAMEKYTNGGELPDDVRTWIDSLPK